MNLAKDPIAQTAYTIGPLDRIALIVVQCIAWLKGRLQRKLQLALLACMVIVFAALIYKNGLSRVVLLTCALYLGVMQAALLARTRTLSFSTLRTLAVVGGAVSALATVGVILSARALFNLSNYADGDAVQREMLTPIIEELAKIIPVVCLIVLSSRGQSMSTIDIVVAGYVTGLGFGYVEEMVRSKDPFAMVAQWQMLLELPTDPGRFRSKHDSMTHALGAAIICFPLALWWRARRRKQNTRQFTLLTVLTFGFVSVTHAELNLQGTSTALRWMVAFFGEHRAIPWLAAAAALAALLIDMHDTRHARSIGWWIVPQIRLKSALAFATSLELNRLERTKTIAQLYGVPPRPEDCWTYIGTQSIQRWSAASGVAIILCVYLSTGPNDFNVAVGICLICQMPGIGDLLVVIPGLLDIIRDAANRVISYVADELELDGERRRVFEHAMEHAIDVSIIEKIQTLIDFSPIGDLRGAIIAFDGVDPFHPDEPVTALDRILGLASVLPYVPNLRQAADAGHAALAARSRYTVGTYSDLRRRFSGLGLDAHHVGQQAVMRRLIPGYNPATAPAILVPKMGHTIRGIDGIGVVSRSTTGISEARVLLARDIRELRRVYPDIPTSSLRELIRMNKELYPDAFRFQRRP